jgi:hypothetical protein
MLSEIGQIASITMTTMLHASLFTLNLIAVTPVAVGVRASSTKTTTIKG